MELTKACALQKHNNLNTYNQQEIEAIEASKGATQNAYAPYSNFRVGAAVLFEDGSMVLGNNQENPAYPSGLCAERVALFHAMSAKSGKTISMLAVSTLNSNNEAHPFAPPCGGCLQVIADVEARQNARIKIVLCREAEYFEADGVEQFLPFRFEL